MDMSTPNNIPQSVFGNFETETPQVKSQNATPTFDLTAHHASSEYDLDKSVQVIEQKELHKERIQALRKELDYLKSTEWEFEFDKGFAQ